MQTGIPMPGRELCVWSAFCYHGNGGNKAGILFPADGLSASERQALATHLGFSETAFLSRGEAGEVAVEFYTPTERIPMCGHALTACGAYLASQGLTHGYTTVTVEGFGKVPVYCGAPDAGIVLESQGSSRHSITVLSHTVGARLSRCFEPEVGFDDPVIVSMGVPFLAARVASRDVLESLQSNQREIEEASIEVEASGLYLYAVGDQPSALSTRMFAPRLGISEESATGMGAAALAAYLTLSRGRIGQQTTHQGPTVSTYEVIQGEGFAPIPGRITTLVTVDGHGELLSVELRGECRREPELDT